MSHPSPLSQLEALQWPESGSINPSVFPVLIFFMIIKAITAFGCMALIFIPIFRKRSSSKTHWWLIRRQYLETHNDTPYLVPNRSLVVAVCELMSSLTYIMLAGMSYVRLKHQISHHQTLIIILCYGISFLPTFIGLWLAGWGLLYSSHCPHKKIKSQFTRIFSPRVFNLSWVTGSILFVIIVMQWGILLERYVRVFRQKQEDLVSFSDTAGVLFSNSTYRADELVLKELKAKETALNDEFHKLIALFEAWAACWVVLEIFLIVFYIFIFQRLVKLIRRLLRLCEAEKFVILNKSDINNSPKDSSEDQKSVAAISAFRKRLQFLALYIFSISLALLGEVAVAFANFYASQRLTNLALISVLSILIMLPSTFLSPILLFQAWQVISQRSVPESDEYESINLAKQIASAAHEEHTFPQDVWN
ncbi:hypothetical protein O181_012887 [Austropuccinia psidii MF-1]|uniref:Uncharacterized protein n=1 Tax=Austropuccinia psidii MF-1 TaxID=1389203 RepID=A0A9Q3GNF4_9BASI|nr:hypothetical protein [Austropuccinia psidii MF-1]